VSHDVSSRMTFGGVCQVMDAVNYKTKLTKGFLFYIFVILPPPLHELGMILSFPPSSN
jgi:hypothetical protein